LNYDIVIIGGGLSGLTSAALFSRAGMSVAVLEMDAKPGGYLAGFQRGEYKFDSAIHWLNQCGPKGSVTRIFSAIGNDFPKAREQVKIRRFSGYKAEFMLTNNPDDLKDELIQAFPHEKKGVIRFFRDAKNIAGAFDNFSNNFRDMQTHSFLGKVDGRLKLLKFGLTLVPYVFYSGSKGVVKGLKKYFNDPELMKIWAAENDLLSCLIPIAWAYNKDYQFPPVGGGQVFPQWLAHKITESGNQIFYQTKALKIVDDGIKATQVVADRLGEELVFNARFVVAACDVETLYEKIMRPELSDPKFLEKLKAADLYSSAVTVVIGLDCPAEELGFGEELIIISEDNIKRSDHNCGDPDKSDITVLAPSTRDKSMAPLNKGTLTIYAPAYFSQFDNLGELYRQIKKEFADILISRVEKKLSIDIRSHISVIDIATPKTYHRYTGNRDGIMMGARPGKNNYQAKIAHYKTPLENVYLSGHWANLGGGVPIAVSTAANTTLLILKEADKQEFYRLNRFLDQQGNRQD